MSASLARTEEAEISRERHIDTFNDSAHLFFPLISSGLRSRRDLACFKGTEAKEEGITGMVWAANGCCVGVEQDGIS